MTDLKIEKLIDLDQTSKLGVFVDQESETLLCLISLKEEEPDTKPYEIFQDIKLSLSLKKDDESEFKSLKRSYLSAREHNREIIIVKFVKSNVYVLCSNGAGVLILREDNLVPLVKTSEDEYLVASGKIRESDSLLFATHSVLSNLPMDLIKSALKENNIALLESSLDVVEEGKALIMATKQTNVAGFELNSTAIVASVKPISTQPSSVKTSLVGLIDKTLASLPRKQIVVEDNEYAFKNKSKSRSASFAGLILLLILGISIFFGLRADKAKKIREQYEPRMAAAQHDLDEAKELVQVSPTRAQELILSALYITDSLKSEGVQDERLEALITDINNNLGPIAGTYVEEGNLYLDLSLISSGFEGDKIALSGEMIRVLDTDEKKLVGIELENKRTSVIAGSEYLPDALDVLVYEDRSFILSGDGIREVTDEVNLTIKSEWNSRNILAASFAGNIYVIEKENNKIWRYQGVKGGFLEKEEWLGEGIVPDFSSEQAMAIDSTIWTLSAGEISNYSQGVATNFSLKNVKNSIDNATDIYADVDSQYLYVLDPQNRRVVVVNKDGQYKGEYISERIANAKDLVVSEPSKKLIVLSDGKLYSIYLKHLN